jgi:hypothetical protein
MFLSKNLALLPVQFLPFIFKSFHDENQVQSRSRITLRLRIWFHQNETAPAPQHWPVIDLPVLVHLKELSGVINIGACVAFPNFKTIKKHWLISAPCQKWVSKNPLKLAIELSLQEARQREGGQTSDVQKSESSLPSTNSSLLCDVPSSVQTANSKVQDEGKNPAVAAAKDKKPSSGRKVTKPAGDGPRVEQTVMGGASTAPAAKSSPAGVSSNTEKLGPGSVLASQPAEGQKRPPLTASSQSEDGATSRGSGRIPDCFRTAF